MVSLFEELGLSAKVLEAVSQMGFEQPTPIQKAAIPALLAGKNVLGQAQTGTGKTAAYVLPLLDKIKPGVGRIQALVLVPTRELAIQVTEAASKMACTSAIRTLAVYGGQSYRVQIRQIERGVELVVGTPGRMLDLIRQGAIDLSRVTYLILDEADEMLAMGFIEDVESIMAQITGERQIALFSATLPKVIRKLADRYMSQPVEITIESQQRTVAETEQRFYLVYEDDKFAALTRILEMEEVKTALIFARTKARTQDVADELIRRGYPAEALHGGLKQDRREVVLNRFRDRAITLLVATDVAGRGLDIDDVSHVINYDLPQDADDYVHRVGRTGRAGRKGVAITFLNPREKGQLRQIEGYIHQEISEHKIPGKEEIIAKRDERFVQSLFEQMGKEDLTNSQQIIRDIVGGDVELLDIAVAAIQMARAGETHHPISDITPPQRFNAERNRKSRNENERPSRQYKKHDETGKTGTTKEKGSLWNHQEQEAGMVRLRMNLGNVHGIRPGDIVGAIAGEVGIPGKAIGQIDIHKDHTFVDVAEKHVKQVLRESGGKYSLRGKLVQLTLAN